MITHTVNRAGRPDLKVDVFEPTERKNGGAVILVHGGAWKFGDRSAMHEYCRRFAAKGFVAIAAQYGLLPAVRWPAPLEDVRDVVRWTKAEAGSLGIDPAKVATVGFSAGAHLILLAAGTSDGTGHERAIGDGAGASVGAVVACFAPAAISAEHVAPGSPVELLLDGGGEERARQISPITYAAPGFPSTLLLVGNADVLTPHSPVLSLYQALDAAGTNPEIHVYARQNHEFTALPRMIEAFVEEAAFFLRRTLLEAQDFLDEDRALNMFSDPVKLAAVLGPPAG